tara:strand:+ start:353 stop:541 length:189 start_codon:yes stop_codon:yes gene_type:complete
MKKNNGKKVKPVVKTAKMIKNVVKTVEPQDVKLAKKIVKNKDFRKKIVDGFLTGITFGLYSP